MSGVPCPCQGSKGIETVAWSAGCFTPVVDQGFLQTITITTVVLMFVKIFEKGIRIWIYDYE